MIAENPSLSSYLNETLSVKSTDFDVIYYEAMRNYGYKLDEWRALPPREVGRLMAASDVMKILEGLMHTESRIQSYQNEKRRENESKS